MSTQLRHSLLLLLTAFIWGVAFVAQSVGMDYVGPFTFTASRSLIGAVVLLPVIWFRTRKETGAGTEQKKGTAVDKKNKKTLHSPNKSLYLQSRISKHLGLGRSVSSVGRAQHF